MTACSLVIHQEMEQGRPLFFYQSGKEFFGTAVSGVEWACFLLCSYTTELLNGFQVVDSNL